MAVYQQGQQADPFGIYVEPGKTPEQAIAGGIFNTPQEAESAGYRFYYPPEAPKALDENKGNVSLDGTPVGGAATTTVPDWATSLLSNNPFDKTSQAYIDAKRARDAAIEANFLKRREEIEAQSSREQGGVSAKFQTGSRTGIGYDSIKEAQINDIKKEAEKAIDNARRAMEEAKISGDETALNNSLKQYQLAMDIKNQATNEALAQAKLKLDALTMSTNLPKGTTFELGGVQYEGLAEPTVDTWMVEDGNGNVSVITKDGKLLSTIEGIGKEEAKKLQYNEINGQLIITDPTTGQEIKRIVVPKQGGGGGGDGGDENDFYADIEKAQADLKSGFTWGEVWNRLKAQYGAPDDVLDSLLNKSQWGQAGAYQEFKKSTASSNQPVFIGWSQKT